MADEMLDIVDDDDQVIDQEMRSVAHALGMQHRGVHVFLFTPEGKMLVQTRSADRIHYPLALDCSISEHVKAGEGYFEAACRGLQEELGITDVELNPLVKFKMNYGPNDNEISALYEGRVDPEKVIFDPGEIEQVAYYDADQIQEMMLEEEVAFCGWFVEIMNWYWGKPNQLTVLKVY